MAKAVLTTVRDQKIGFIKTSDFFTSKITYARPQVKINYDLPFRVKFVNIGVEGYGPNNPAPIGIAIIGVNNYIL